MNEYKKLLVLVSALENLEGIKIPMGIITGNIHPLRKYAEYRIEEIEMENKWR